MYFVYVLRCQDDSLYTGITTDLPRRLGQHRGELPGGAKYTMSHPPVGYAGAFLASGRREALRLEWHIKALPRAEKLELLSGQMPEGFSLFGCRPISITSQGRMNQMLVLCYPRCGTCKKALAWLQDRGMEYDLRDIKEDKPTLEELQAWYKASGLPLKRFFNTSGLVYKELELSKKLPTLSEEEQLELLASDGMLVKRPIAILDQRVLVGFKPEEWEAAFGQT